jgi:hypothetical protein
MQHQQELLAAITDGRVPSTKRGLDGASDVSEKGITGSVTALVVDALEMVDIDQQDPDLGAGSGAARGFARC